MRRMMTLMKSKNGEVSFSKNFIALATLIILLTVTVSSAVAYTVGVKTSVDNINADIDDIQADIKDLDPRISMNEKDIAVIKAHYESIDLSLQDIKRKLET